MKNNPLALLGFILLSAPLAAMAQFTYTTNNGTITITGYNGPGGAVTIPSTINGLPVATIGDSAFNSIGSLTSVTIPGSVTSIGDGVFAACTSLIAVTVDAANTSYSSANGVLFNKSLTTLIEYPGAKTGSYAIPGSVTNIGNFAFAFCYNLSSVTIPSSVTSIGNEAFDQCYNLASITIPSSVTNIGGAAFQLCTSLTSVAIPSSIKSIPSYAFYECTSLASVTIPGSVTNIGNYALTGCTSLTNITIPFGVTNIPFDTLRGCSSLRAINVDAANPAYSSLDGVLFNKSQTTLIQYPAGRTGSYAIPGSVTSIGDWAFNSCTSLAALTIPGSVTSIGEEAFSGCTSLTNVAIPGSVTSMGYEAFAFCTSLTGVFFKGNAPSAVSMPIGVFAGDYNATVYYLPGTTGWGPLFGDRGTRLWNPLMQSSGVGPAGFGFNITGTADIPIVIEAAASLANPSWVPLQSLNLTNGAFYFSDPNWTNYPARFYRIRSP